MNKIKYGLVAGVMMLSFAGSSALPTFAEPCEVGDEACEAQSSDVILVGDTDELLLQNQNSDPVALATVTATPASVSVALGEEKTITVSYNEGFDIENLDETETGIEFASGDDEYVAYIGFNGEYNHDTEMYEEDWNSVYVYGNEIGTATYTLTATDNDGNVATTSITVTTEDALGSGYANVGEETDDYYMVNYEVGATFATPVAGGRDLSLELVPMTDALRALDDNLNTVLEINVVDENDNVVPVSGNDTEMWFGVRKEMLGDLAEAEQLYFQVAYIEDGAIAQFYDAYDIEDDGWGWMFSVDGINHFSQYGILVSETPFESAESRNAKITDAKAPDSGALTDNSGTEALNNTSLITTIVICTAALAGYSAVKRFKADRK